jgi:putative sterol carrier protein
MATEAEIFEALTDYRRQCNGNERLRRMQRDWTRRIQFEAADTGDRFTMEVVAGEVVSVAPGLAGNPDIVVSASSEDLCDMFWGDLNPTQKYLRGEILVKAAPEDVMRLDAIAMVIWPEA